MWYMAPKIYSYDYCMALLEVMLLYAIPFLIHKIRRLSFLNFNTFFLFSYISINYLHAVFIYPDDNFLPSFSFYYNIKCITSAVALASVGIAFYMFGNVLFEKKNVSHNRIKSVSVNAKLVFAVERVVFLVSLIIFLYVFLFLVISGDTLHHLPGRFIAAVGAIFALSFYYKAEFLSQQHKLQGIGSFIHYNKLHIVAVLLFTLAQLRMGSRSGVLTVLLFLLLVIYNYYFKIKSFYIILLGMIGVFVLSIVSITRVSVVNLSNSSVLDVISFGFEKITENQEALWLLSLDLVVNSRTLYEAIDFVPQCGLLYGVSYIPQLFCFIPGGGAFVSTLFFGKLPVEMNSGMILSDFANSPYGLGTNMIADLYINFALSGVIIIPFLLGILINYSVSCDTKYKYMLYGTFFSQAIFLPRAMFLMWTDMFVMLVLFDWTMRAITRYGFKRIFPCLKITL